MDESGLRDSIQQYCEQLAQVQVALRVTASTSERQSLLSLQADLEQLLALTRQSLAAVAPTPSGSTSSSVGAAVTSDDKIDDEYALFTMEMAKSGAFENDNTNKEGSPNAESDDDGDIEDDLTSLPGMKCGVYHTHKWGGQPTLHSAMVASVERSNESQFKDLQVRVLFTHPTHAEMLPCPFYLDGECRFTHDQCRYSHGDLVPFSSLQEAIEPNFEILKIGSHVLVKLKPPDDVDIALTMKSSEKYHLWHRGVVKSINIAKRICQVKIEQGGKSADQRHSTDELQIAFEELFPLNDVNIMKSDTDDSLSDTDYAESTQRNSEATSSGEKHLIVEKSSQYNGPAMGEWERHTRGIGSKLMFAMGYVVGTGLGVSSDGRVEPVPARVLPVGKSLDHCMNISKKKSHQDPLKVEQKLKHLQKKEEERCIRAHEREKEREKQNVFNFLNKTLGDRKYEPPISSVDCQQIIKKSTSKNLNTEQFRITEEVKKIEKDTRKLKNSLYRHARGSNIHKNISAQLEERKRELETLRHREKVISREQSNREDKRKLTLF